VLALGVVALTTWALSSAPPVRGQTTSQVPFLVVGLIGSAALLWTASAAVALSVGSGSLVAVLQNWLLSRDAKPET
jgi:hypothetical protein